MSLKAGTIIECPECKIGQLKSSKDIKPGGQLKDGGWDSLGFDMENAKNMTCYKCGNFWSRRHPKYGHSQIHVKDSGWIELSKEPNAAPKRHIIQ